MIVARSKNTRSINLKPLGPLLLLKRVDSDKTLKETSRKLGICHQTLFKWEHGIRAPQIKLYPKIVAYLGYDPWANASLGFGERLRQARLRLGLSREILANRLGIGVDCYGRWEDGKITRPHLKERRLLEAFLRDGIPGNEK